MRFIRYEENNQIHFGVLKTEAIIVPISKLIQSPIIDLQQIILLTKEDLQDIEDKMNQWKGLTIAVDNVKVLTPIPNPKRNVFCLGKNYLEHAKELEGKTANLSGVPKFPIYFTKTASPSIGPDETILLHESITDGNVDYEVELAIIIGKEGVDIKAENAEDYIFGYTILNDVSARSLQTRHTQWFRGKCLDTHCPMGPVVVHKNEIEFPIQLELTSEINGEVRQVGNTRDMIFDIPTIISDLSRGTRLYPGDIIATGTPSGVGMGFDPPKYLKSGDVIECKIEKIGILRNYVK